MRSPWRFLADLASRQPRDKAPEAVPAVTLAEAPEDKLKDKAEKPAGREVEGDVAARVPETPTNTVDAAAVSVEAVKLSIAASPADALAKTTGPAEAKHVVHPAPRKSSTAKVGKLRAQPRGTVAPQAEKHAASRAGETEATAPTVVKLKGKSRAKTGSAAAKAGNAAISKSEAAIQPQSLRDPFVVEMESLDEDVRKLKLLLAEKLKMQNEHLRTLLKRFDRP
uniref:hypothetical protein n=1 Tax=uncultured Rhizobium sp. TaxID=155567 RepID=UPI00260B1707|nr:hypothetical protein [uncultured Rhizobium sp.]